MGPCARPLANTMLPLLLARRAPRSTPQLAQPEPVSFRWLLSRLAVALLLLFTPLAAFALTPNSKQLSLDQWRALTAPAAPAPKVFVKGDHIRFLFETPTNTVGFAASWSRTRAPASDYKINSAILRLDPKLSRATLTERGWREAAVITGVEWRHLTTNMIAALSPPAPGHAFYYQGFIADRLWYRDAQGAPRFVPMGEQPKGTIIDRRFSMEETLEHFARTVEQHLSETRTNQSLILLMPPSPTRFTQPLLLDRKQRRCVWLLPAALYDTTERGLGLTATAQSAEALFLEAHGLALLKNPISSAARLADLAVVTVVRFLRLPLPRGHTPPPPLGEPTPPPQAGRLWPTNRTLETISLSGSGGLGREGDGVLSNSPPQGMDLTRWENWLDKYTGTRRELGSLSLLLNGEQFFPRLKQAIAEATNHISLNVYIFDRDDVGVEVADQLKHRATEVPVKVIFDRMGSIAAGLSPPATPLPEDFVPPSSISSYLRNDSRVHVRPFLNPWFSADHSKVILVDGTQAWLGGMNLGREYRYEWHDLMVELHGPVVTSLEDGFRRDWAHAGLLGDLAYFSALLTPPHHPPAEASSNNWTQVRLLPTKTAWKPFANAVFGALHQARSYIYVENPYLFDKKVVRALVLARARGVDVRVIMPRVNDLKAGGRSNLVTANYLLQKGVRVYFYPGMTHIKAVLADGWSCLGSANLNHLSLRLCQEQNVATSDPAFAAHVKHELFEEDFSHSYELTEPVSVDWLDVLADLVLESF
jgi:phosphatidylserine/phosphatidylglycerophosphate/cardiolipin synthase-like enzyme